MLSLKKNTLTPISEDFYNVLWSLANPLLLGNHGDFAAGRKNLSETGEVFLLLDGDGKHLIARLDRAVYKGIRDTIRHAQFLDTVQRRFAEVNAA